MTEEFHPGFRNSVAAYTVSLLNPKVIRDLDLPRHGLRVVERKLANFLPLDETQYLKIGAGKTEQEVLAADAEWARAYRACDMTLMDKVMHDNIMYIHAHARVDTKPLLMKQFSTCANEETIINPLRVLVQAYENDGGDPARTVGNLQGQATELARQFQPVLINAGLQQPHTSVRIDFDISDIGNIKLRPRHGISFQPLADCQSSGVANALRADPRCATEAGHRPAGLLICPRLTK